MSHSGNNDWSSLKDILESQFEKLASSKQNQLPRLKKKWPELVGSAIAKHSKILYIKQQILYINVPDSTWRCELNLLKAELLKKLNAEFVENNNFQLKDLKFVLRGE